jgi:glycine betaine/proline transport system ATP-binding protein
VEPELWYLDEPFSALDPLIRREMQDEFLRLQNVLHKTIVFITHDFDEAIRLADKVAIMKDGGIDQVGTPEEIVTRPATAYVKEFTRDVSRAKVLSVGAVMTRGNGSGEIAGELSVKAKVADVGEQLLGTDAPFAVVDGEGRRVGHVDREAVISVLLQQ